MATNHSDTSPYRAPVRSVTACTGLVPGGHGQLADAPDRRHRLLRRTRRHGGQYLARLRGLEAGQPALRRLSCPDDSGTAGSSTWRMARHRTDRSNSPAPVPRSENGQDAGKLGSTLGHLVRPVRRPRCAEPPFAATSPAVASGPVHRPASSLRAVRPAEGGATRGQGHRTFPTRPGSGRSPNHSPRCTIGGVHLTPNTSGPMAIVGGDHDGRTDPERWNGLAGQRRGTSESDGRQVKGRDGSVPRLARLGVISSRPGSLTDALCEGDGETGTRPA